MSPSRMTSLPWRGYTCQRGPQPDTDSIDATINSGDLMRTRFDVQLKAILDTETAQRRAPLQTLYYDAVELACIQASIRPHQ